MAQSPIVVIATDELEKSITIAMRDDQRIEYFLGSRYHWIRDKLDRWIREEWFNYAVSALTKNAHRIEMHTPLPVEIEPTSEGYRQYAGSVTGRMSSSRPPWEGPTHSVAEYLNQRSQGMNLEEIGRQQYGFYNWAALEARILALQEDDMRRKPGDRSDYKGTPDATYRFTVIAPQAQSFHYHQQRRWFKSEQDAKDNAATVLEDTTADIELAIVECKDVFKRKPKVELMSTFKKSRR